MSFKLSIRSLNNLSGVKPQLVQVVKTAITLTKVDFGVIQGLRTLEEQKKLVDKGASQTLKSKHLTGDAVDLMAYIGSRGSWELSLYDEIADAMKQSAKIHDTKLRWGAAWTVPDIKEWSGSMEEAMNSYVDLRRSQKRRVFIDAPHFELN